MRLLFAGTPEIAVTSLVSLAGRHEICGVLTNPDRPSGRGRKPVYSPVKEKALELGLSVFQPERLNSEFHSIIREMNPDLLVVVAFSRIFGPKFMGLFPKGGINLHPSLLPKYRGPSPIQAAILNGDERSGITVQKLALEMDAGDILLQKEISLNGLETAGSLTELCAHLGAPMMLEAVDSIEAGTVRPVPQIHENATYCRLIEKTDGLIDWNLSAEEISRLVRGYNPWPAAYTTFGGAKLTVWDAKPLESSGGESRPNPGTVTGMDKKVGILIQTGNGVLSISRLQLQAKKAMDHVSFLNGVHDFIGSTLGG